MNFVFFVYGCCLDRLVKKIFIKKGLYSSDFQYIIYYFFFEIFIFDKYYIVYLKNLKGIYLL